MAIHRFAKSSPLKARLVMDLIRGKSANEAQRIVRFCNKRGAAIIDKILRSAIASADVNSSVDVDALVVAEAVADDGTMLHRWQAGPQGRAMPIKKRRAHLRIVLRQAGEEEKE